MPIITAFFNGDVASLAKAKELASRLVKLDRVYEEEWLSYPGGVEKREIEHHRFGDYFNATYAVLAPTFGGAFLSVTFKVKHNVKTVWKRLVVDTICQIETEIPGVKVSLRNIFDEPVAMRE